MDPRGRELRLRKTEPAGGLPGDREGDGSAAWCTPAGCMRAGRQDGGRARDHDQADGDGARSAHVLCNPSVGMIPANSEYGFPPPLGRGGPAMPFTSFWYPTAQYVYQLQRL